jgi:hypothetical protein
MNGKLMALLMAGMGLLGPHLLAEDIVLPGQDARGTLVELYSSEGCSSCPPAEKWMSQLKDDPRLWKQIFPVAFHVDYWDNLGWPDRFASKAYTQRQYDYAARWNSSDVYTPELIVDGHEWRRWFGGLGLPLAKPEDAGPLRVVVQNAPWNVTVTHGLITATRTPHLTVNVAWLGMNISSDVRAGENAGRTLVHDFVVLDFQSKVADFTIKDGISAQFPAPVIRSASDRPAAIVAWISYDDGSILQVTGGWLK